MSQQSSHRFIDDAPVVRTIQVDGHTIKIGYAGTWSELIERYAYSVCPNARRVSPEESALSSNSTLNSVIVQ